MTVRHIGQWFKLSKILQYGRYLIGAAAKLAALVIIYGAAAIYAATVLLRMLFMYLGKRVAASGLAKSAKAYYYLLPKEARIIACVPVLFVGLLFVAIAFSVLTAFIHPGALAYGPYGISDEFGDERAFYCKHLAAPKGNAGAWPVTCKTPELLASVVVPFTPIAHYDGDKYAWGNCTYWVSLQRMQAGRPIPNTWGDAYLWASRSANDGYTVDHHPTPGSIMQISWGVGHVAYVESVSPGGAWHISEMNVAGFNLVDYRTLPASAAAKYEFIH